MRSKEYFIETFDIKARKQIVEIIQIACEFQSSVTIEIDSKKFNGKSIVVMEKLKKGDHFHLIIEGVDEQETMAAFEKFFDER